MLLRVIGATFGRWRERRQRRAAISELRAVDDRTLKDMGLTRGEIVAAVDGLVYRGEQVRPHEPEPPPSRRTPGAARIETIDPAELQGHIARARRARAEYVADLCIRGLRALLRLSRPVRRPPRCNDRPNASREETGPDLRPMVPILRMFGARAHPGCQAALAAKLATTSAELVRHQPGLLGFLASGPASDAERDFVFITIWRDAAALKAFFGEEWSVSLLPPGYAELIEASSVEHYHLTAHFQAHETGRA